MPRKKKQSFAEIEAEYIPNEFPGGAPTYVPLPRPSKELTEKEIIRKFRRPHPHSTEFKTRPNLSWDDIITLSTKYKTITTGLSTMDKLQVAEDANWALKLAGKPYIGDDPEYEDDFEPENIDDEVAKLIVETQKPFSKLDKAWWTSGKNTEGPAALIDAIVERDSKISRSDYTPAMVIYYLKIRLAEL